MMTTTTSTMRTPVWAVALALSAVVLAGCGGDITDEQADPAATSAAPSEPAATSAPTPAADASARGGGEVTLGDTTFAFVPDVQCQIGSDGSFAVIAGHAVDDPDTEFSVDAVDGDPRVDTTVDGQYLSATGDAVTVTIDGSTVTGTATLSDGVDAREASFKLSCG